MFEIERVSRIYGGNLHPTYIVTRVSRYIEFLCRLPRAIPWIGPKICWRLVKGVNKVLSIPFGRRAWFPPLNVIALGE